MRGEPDLQPTREGGLRNLTKGFAKTVAGGELPEFSAVIVSEAKQSISPHVLNHGLLRFARNDGVRPEAITTADC